MASVVHRTIRSFDRSTTVGSVLASFTETAALLARYESGSLSLDELGAAIERHVTQMENGEAVEGAA
jgi:hypothetical protein